MKKVYYILFVLVMVMTGIVVTSCGGDEEEDIDIREDEEEDIDIGGNGRTFLFGYDDNRETIEGSQFMELEDYFNPVYYVGWPDDVNHFSIDRPDSGGQIHIEFFKKEASFFKVGYSDFAKDATRIVYITSSWQGWDGEYVSGKAKVTSNNGEYITIQFSKFKCKVEDRNDREHTILLDGTLKFYVYRY